MSSIDPFLKTNVIIYLKSYHTEESIDELVDQEIVSGNWVDDDWEEDGEFEDEYSWYAEFGRGEAEDAVRDQLEVDILKEFNLTKEQYLTQSGEELYQTIAELFTKLDT